MTTTRSNCWSVTINNPLPIDEENIALARQKGWKVDGQLERGAQGTLHYQLIVRTPQVRFSALKKAFPRAHIEASRNPTALAQYVQKDQTRVASLSVDQSRYPSQLQIFRWFAFYYRDSKKDNPDITNLQIFDLMIRQKIRQGYYIGAECMNPQIRAFFKKFGDDVAFREISSLDRQTDRQAIENSQSVNIPEYASSPSSTPLQEETTDSSPSDDEGPS